jgi:DNA polymerase-3 subunit gamma/tau
LIGRPLKVRFEKAAGAVDAPAEVAERDRSTRQRAAEESLAGDPGVQSLLREFGGRLVSDSIKADSMKPDSIRADAGTSSNGTPVEK